MNNRLQKLVKQATHDVLGVKQLDSVILAELIVKECANIARQTESDDSDDYKSGRTWASLDISEHFGV